MPDYWLDSNVFIDSKNRYYAFDLVPGFWIFIEDKAREGVIASSTVVYQELVDKGNDDLATWARERKSLIFVEPDRAVQETFADIANHVGASYANVHASRFLEGADPWLIAHAKTYGGVVVTQETRTTGSPKPKIPNVCAHFQVRSCDLFEMLRAMRASFR